MCFSFEFWFLHITILKSFYCFIYITLDHKQHGLPKKDHDVLRGKF